MYQAQADHDTCKGEGEGGEHNPGIPGIMTPMWCSLKGGLMSMRKLRPVFNLLQGHQMRTPRRGLRTFRQGCRQWQSVSEPIIKIVVIRSPSALVHGLWAPVPPSPITCSYKYMDIYMFVRVCKDGMKRIHWKTWTQLVLFACLLLLTEMSLLIQRYIFWHTVLYIICCEC